MLTVDSQALVIVNDEVKNLVSLGQLNARVLHSDGSAYQFVLILLIPSTRRAFWSEEGTVRTVQFDCFYCLTP